MSTPDWGTVRDCMNKKVTEIDGRMDILTAMKVMKDVGSTSLIVERRDEDDEY